MNQPPRPLVSVVCATYQYGRFLAGAIDSVLAQTYSRVEMVVVDDGSTDETADVLARYGARIVSVATSNRGQNAAFNTAMRFSRGSIVCLLDADDRMRPDKIERVVAAFNAEPEAGWLFHALRYVALPTGVEVDDPITARTPLPPGGRYDMRDVMRDGRAPIMAPAASGVVITRSVADLLFPLPELKDFGDHFLKFGAMASAPGIVLSEQLADQGVHDNNAYTNRSDLTVFRSRRLINLALELAVWDPSLGRFTDDLLAQGLWMSRFGRLLPLAERKRLRGWRQRSSLLAQAKVVRQLARLAIRRARGATTVRLRPMTQPRPGEAGPRTSTRTVVYALRRYPVLSESFISNEIAALEAAGVSVAVWSMEDGDAGIDARPVLRPAPAATIEVAWFWIRQAVSRPRTIATLLFAFVRMSGENAALFLRAAPSLWKALADEEVQRAHTHFFASSTAPAYYLALLLRVPFSVTAHARDIYLPRANQLRYAAVARPVVTVCRYNVSVLNAQGVPTSRIRIVPCGVEVTDASEQGRDEESVVAVGRLVEKKGFDVLLRSVAQMIGDHPKLLVTIVGGGPLADDLHNLRREYRLEEHVRFAGPLSRDQSLETMRRATLLVVPSRRDAEGDTDAVPVVIREAMMRGTPVVATMLAGIPEIVDETTGWPANPADVDNLAAVLDAALRQPTERARRAQQARERVLRTATLTVQAETLLRVWHEH